MSVPGISGGPPGGGVLPPTTSSDLRASSGGNSGCRLAESINRRAHAAACGVPSKTSSRKHADDGIPDGEYTLADIQQMVSGSTSAVDGGWDPWEAASNTNQAPIIVEHRDGSSLAGRALGRMAPRQL